MAEPGTRVVESNLRAAAELTESSRPPLRRIRWLFACGAAAGVLCAGLGIVRSGQQSAVLPPGAVARVGEAVIWRAEWERAIAALSLDRKTPLEPADRTFALNRLIDEELLLQRALEMDLPRTDVRARRALVSAVIDSVVTSQDAVEPSDAELRRFYAANREWFEGPELFRVWQIWFRAETPEESAAAEARARSARARIASGEPFEEVRRAFGDQESPPVPNTLLPASKLGELLGPTALRTLLQLAPGTVSEPVRSATGWHILLLAERRRGDPPPFEDVRAQVLQEFRRRAADQALRTYLDELRARTNVVVAPDVEQTGETPPHGKIAPKD